MHITVAHIVLQCTVYYSILAMRTHPFSNVIYLFPPLSSAGFINVAFDPTHLMLFSAENVLVISCTFNNLFGLYSHEKIVSTATHGHALI
ncbi:hypothetical protein VNO80_12556 [Phaseolus coccineus]|uniref:Uncharacterized protein n=1 Tax=Phaseolus coccineus TaxID=3886 RepID=A0AAN9N5L8_PHACN